MNNMTRNPANLHRKSAAWACSIALLTLACPSAHAVQDCEFQGKHINTGNGAETAGKTGMVRLQGPQHRLAGA